MAVKIQLRRGATTDWPGSLVLDAGEVGVDTTTKQYKVGDGTTTWSVLPYWGSGTITQITAGTGLKLNTVAGATSTGGVVTLDVDTATIVARSIVSAKGQVVVGGGVNSPVALPASGTNNFVLVADSADATYGVKWGNVVEASIANDAVTTAKIADSTITAAKLATNAVITAKILDANVTTAKIATDAVTTAKILNGSVNADKLATDAVTTAKILNGSVTDVKLADSAVTTAKINNLAVNVDKLANLSVTGAKIANSTITAGKLDTAYVQQGTGTGQLGNLVKIGWTGSALHCQIDNTNFAKVWPIDIGGSAASVTTQTSANNPSTVVQRAANGSFAASSIQCIGLDYTGGQAGFFGYTTSAGNGALRAGAYDNNGTAITTNQSTGNYHMAFYYNGSNIGSVYGTTSNCSFNTTSDYRLKENVIPLANSLSIIEQIKPKSFNFIAEPDKTYDGFIAHELAKVVPYAVTGKKDELDEKGKIKPQQVDYSKLVAVIVGAVQELSTRVKDLENNK